MSESIFIAEGERFVPTEQARGPWDPRALHGGAPAALIAAAFERIEPGAELRIARLGFELLRPIPFAPLTLVTRIVRPGRRVQELAAELHAGEQLICRASALRVAAGPRRPAGERRRAPGAGAAMPPPRAGQAGALRARRRSTSASFAAIAMEMRWLDDPRALGPGRVWMRLRHPLLPGEPLSPLARLAATADFGNGVSAALPFERFVFINADLTIHLHRLPRGRVDRARRAHAAARRRPALAESVLHDLERPVGRAFQTLVVAAPLKWWRPLEIRAQQRM